MKTIVITGSPGAGKNTVANSLSESLREHDISHAVIDPDELARIHPEKTQDLKWQALNNLYPIYDQLNLEYLLVPVTIDSDTDHAKLVDSLGKGSVVVIHLSVDTKTLTERVITREPNKYWQEKLSGLVASYAQNGHKRTFDMIDINATDKTVGEITNEILDRIFATS